MTRRRGKPCHGRPAGRLLHLARWLTPGSRAPGPGGNSGTPTARSSSRPALGVRAASSEPSPGSAVLGLLASASVAVPGRGGHEPPSPDRARRIIVGQGRPPSASAHRVPSGPRTRSAWPCAGAHVDPGPRGPGGFGGDRVPSCRVPAQASTGLGRRLKSARNRSRRDEPHAHGGPCPRRADEQTALVGGC